MQFKTYIVRRESIYEKINRKMKTEISSLSQVGIISIILNPTFQIATKISCFACLFGFFVFVFNC